MGVSALTPQVFHNFIREFSAKRLQAEPIVVTAVDPDNVTLKVRKHRP